MPAVQKHERKDKEKMKKKLEAGGLIIKTDVVSKNDVLVCTVMRTEFFRFCILLTLSCEYYVILDMPSYEPFLSESNVKTSKSAITEEGLVNFVPSALPKMKFGPLI